MEQEYITDKYTFEKLCRYTERGLVSEIRELFDDLRLRTGKKVPNRFTLCPPPCLERQSPLVLAALHGRLEVLEFFCLEYGEVVDLNCTCTVSYSLPTRRYSSVGAAYSGKMRSNVTPLIAAGMGGHGMVAEYLLMQGVAVDAADCCGWTALFHAVAAWSEHSCKVLISYGADVNCVDCHGNSPLCIRMLLGTLDEEAAILNWLLDHQAFPIGRERNPMYLAAINGDNVSAELSSLIRLPLNVYSDCWWLLGASARLNQVGPHGRSAYYYWKLALLEKRCYPPPPKAYGSREPLQSRSDLTRCMGLPPLQREVEMLYQSLIACERILGYKFCYEIVSLASVRMFSRGFRSKGQLLLIRALNMHHEFEQWAAERHHGRQHDMNVCLKLLSRCQEQAKELHQWGIPPMWACYIQYGIRQLRLANPFHFASHIKDQLQLDVLQICHIIFSIFSLWIECSQGQKSECLIKQLTEFVHTVNSTNYLGGSALFVLLQEFRSPHTEWRTPQRLEEILRILLTELNVHHFINARNADGNTLLHLAALLENEECSIVALSLLLECDAHIDTLNYDLKTPREIYRATHSHYPEEVSDIQLTEFAEVPALCCLAARVVVKEGLPYELMPFLPPTVKCFLRLHGSY